MKKVVAIEFNKVSKQFQKGQKLYLKQAILDFLHLKKQENFWALKDVSFKIYKGETVGIIGANGSGKSTLLKMIAGVLVPTKGQVKVNGKIGPLIELGAGFHPELTGRDNIYLNGSILGLSKAEIDQKFDSIVSFAELWDFIDTPVKHYSSGMYMRLGFSVAIHIDPDILIVDEIFAVGDIDFQKKCLEKISEYKQSGVTVIIVSHSLKTIELHCNRAILIKKGRVVIQGLTNKVIEKYKTLHSIN